MKHSEAIFETHQGARYLEHLCAHWVADFVVETGGIWARILLPQTICKLIATPSNLLIQLELLPDADARQMETIVEEHLRHLATTEEVRLAWRRH